MSLLVPCSNLLCAKVPGEQSFCEVQDRRDCSLWDFSPHLWCIRSEPWSRIVSSADNQISYLYCESEGTYHSVDISEPHENATLAGVFPQHATVILPGHEIDEDVLAIGVIGPSDFSPRHVHLSSSLLAQSVLSKEEHEARPIFIHGPPVTLHESSAFNDIRELDLLVAR